MNKTSAPNRPDKVKIGRTEVNVFKNEFNPQTRKETIKKIHQGIVVQNFGAFVRVYNNAKIEDGGDVNQLCAELYPLDSRACWCELVGTRDEDNKFYIAPELR